MVKNWKQAGEIDGGRILELKKLMAPILIPRIKSAEVSLADALMALVEMQHDILAWSERVNPAFLLERVPVDPNTGKVIEE